MSNLPDVLVVGPMKAGTTWLHEYLETVGDVCLPKGVKETFYFDLYYDKSLSWYKSHFRFKNRNDIKMSMEIAPSYFHNIEAPQRIYDSIGNIPIVFTLRDPIKRSWSHYLHLRRYGYTDACLQDAVKEFPQIISASKYSYNIQRWMKYFPEQNIHILWQEDLAKDPIKYAQNFRSILNLPFTGLSTSSLAKSNEAAAPASSKLAALGRRLSYALRARRFYIVVNLAKYLGLKKLFFGVPGKRQLPTMSAEDKLWLANQLYDDFNALPSIFKYKKVILPIQIVKE